MMEITKKSLLEYGMVETDDRISPLEKVIGKDEEVGSLIIGVTLMRNQAELCLWLPDSAVIYLNINSIEELKAFEKCIACYEPNY